MHQEQQEQQDATGKELEKPAGKREFTTFENIQIALIWIAIVSALTYFRYGNSIKELVAKFNEPPVVVRTPADILDRDFFFPDNYYVGMGENFSNSLDAVLSPRHQKVLLTYVHWLSWGSANNSRFDYVPELYIPEEHRKDAGGKLLKDNPTEEVNNFFTPWAIRLYGSEGACWRERAKRAVSYEKWPLMLKAANMNDPEAVFLYAFDKNSERVRDDCQLKDKELREYLLRSADLGYAPAMRVAGNCFGTGECKYMPKLDYKKALYYYEKALMTDPNGVEAACLSFLYMKGDGVPVDMEKAYMYSIISTTLSPHIYTLASVIAKNLTEEQKVRAEALGLVIALPLVQKTKERKGELERRWIAMLPEIKEDIRQNAPWMMWAFVPKELRTKICEETYARRLAMGDGVIPAPPLPVGTVPIPFPFPKEFLIDPKTGLPVDLTTGLPQR